MRQIIQTHQAPLPVGSYSQAIQVGNAVYLAGQIPVDPTSLLLVEGEMVLQVTRVFDNLKMVAEAAGGGLDDIVKLTVYLMDLSNIDVVNEVIKKYFKLPYPARTSVQVAKLPINASIEVDAIMVLN